MMVGLNAKFTIFEFVENMDAPRKLITGIIMKLSHTRFRIKK